MTLQQRMKDFRESHGYSIEDMAHRMGLSIKFYTRYESGKSDMSRQLMERFSELSGYPMDTLTRPDEAALQAATTFAQKLRLYRKSNGYSPDKLGACTGLGGAAIRSYELEGPPPTDHAVYETLAQALGCDPSALGLDSPARKRRVHLEIQTQDGNISAEEIFAKVAAFTDAPQVQIYLKPLENTVYYMARGSMGSFHY